MAPLWGAELFGTRPGPPPFGVPLTIVKPAMPGLTAGGGHEGAIVELVVVDVVLVVLVTDELDVVGTVVFVELVVGGGPGQAAAGDLWVRKRFGSWRMICPPNRAQKRSAPLVSTRSMLPCDASSRVMPLLLAV